jgi:hypothetical protein
MTSLRPNPIFTSNTRTTPLPDTVLLEALHLLATGSITERMRAAQILANAYAEDEERRLASEE